MKIHGIATPVCGLVRNDASIVEFWALAGGYGMMREGEEYGVQFYYQDFRPMFRDGQTRARELGFYIQKYCGCVFSEQERYQKPSRIIP